MRSKYPAERFRTQDDYVIQAFSTNGTCQAFNVRRLPWRLRGRKNFGDLHASLGEDEEEWTRFRVKLSPDERTILDEALKVAGKVPGMEGSSRAERLEAMAQEYVAEHAQETPDDESEPTKASFRTRNEARARYEAQLEVETQNWSMLPATRELDVPEGKFDGVATAEEIDVEVRRLATMRASWDDALGHTALAVKESGIHRTLGFAGWAQPTHLLDVQFALDKVSITVDHIGFRRVTQRELRAGKWLAHPDHRLLAVRAGVLHPRDLLPRPVLVRVPHYHPGSEVLAVNARCAARSADPHRWSGRISNAHNRFLARGTYQYHSKGAIHSVAKLHASSKLSWAPCCIGISSIPRSQRSAQRIALHGIPSTRKTTGMGAWC